MQTVVNISVHNGFVKLFTSCFFSIKSLRKYEINMPLMKIFNLMLTGEKIFDLTDTQKIPLYHIYVCFNFSFAFRLVKILSKIKYMSSLPVCKHTDLTFVLLILETYILLSCLSMLSILMEGKRFLGTSIELISKS